MGLLGTIEVTEADVCAEPRPVRKKMYDATTNDWAETRLYTVYQTAYEKRRDLDRWLLNTYGPNGQYDPNRYWAGCQDRFIMCEKIYMFYKLKWDGKL
jgi:hypothetical protein